MKPGEEWKQADKAERWVSRRPRLPRQSEAERTIVENILPRHVTRVLDLGTGDGHLLGLIRRSFPTARAVGVDISEPMLAAARTQFAGASDVEFLLHDLSEPLTGNLGTFDVVFSGLAIHHLLHERKRSLFREVFDLLEPGGVFCVFDVVASPTHPTSTSEPRLPSASARRTNTPPTAPRRCRISSTGSPRRVSRTSTATGSGSS
jgi:SAM-dependent methyltransferase